MNNKTIRIRHIKLGILSIVFLMFLSISIGGGIGRETVNAAVVVKQKSVDLNIIPDKRNTKAKTPAGGFKEVTRGGTLKAKNASGKDVDVTLLDSGTTQKINLQYAHKNLKGTVIFENYDFSKNLSVFCVLGENVRNSKSEEINFIFKNCVFNSFSVGREERDYVSYTFERCTFKSFSGSNTKFEKCYFGGGVGDRIIPFCNITLNKCYIANPPSSIKNDGIVHVDGTQIYGWKTTKAHDIRFTGCRFEMPAVAYPTAPNTYVNACIMLQLEFNDGYNMKFSDCYLNGGGYTIYAHAKGDSWKMSNIVFNNITFGCSARFGRLYYKVDSAVETNQKTWKDASSIYVGTVKRSAVEDSTFMTVSNDTNVERTFKVCTSTGHTYTYKIAACPTAKEFSGKTFDDFPFDIQYKIPEKCQFIVVYDVTNGTPVQVRYVNWSNKVKFKKTKVSGKTVTITWKKASDVTGYQLQCSSKKTFTSATTKTVKIKGLNNTKVKVTNKKKANTYYTRIRTYKVTKINGKNAIVYGKWSAIKTLKK